VLFTAAVKEIGRVTDQLSIRDLISPSLGAISHDASKGCGYATLE
jgi:hypothetical protein